MPSSNIMKWFRKKRSRSLDSKARSFPQQNGTPLVSSIALARIPAPLLERIFTFVCPHAHDETYETCEESAIEDRCMLCDLRDLAHCAGVSKKWRAAAVNVLYHSIRIDGVHYCPREEILAEKRKRRSFLNRNAEPEDTAQARLRLLCRTLRDDQTGLALKVQFFKTPYMTREACKADLARTVAVTPNLRYVDLPEGVYMDDPSCNTLKLEIQGRCPDLRKMTYMRGSERSLELLAGTTLWRNLEVLELSRLNMDPTILRHALGSLPLLRALKISDMKTFNDQIFHHNDQLPPWPALTELHFSNVPNITAEGLAIYLFRSDTQNSLKSLSLTSTGVQPSTLQQILATAPKLTYLSIIESVPSSFPPGVQYLSSGSLGTLHYEITSAGSANSYANTTASYYGYLTASLISNGLPALRQLFVRDPDFAGSLLDLTPPKPAFASSPDSSSPRSPQHSPSSTGSSSMLSPNTVYSPKQDRFSSNNPFAKAATGLGLKQELEVFSKGLDEMEWNFSKVQPGGKDRRGSATVPRPISSYGLENRLSNSWNQGGARKSVVVGNGFGGFLSVPSDDGARPSSSAGEKGRSSQYDMWR